MSLTPTDARHRPNSLSVVSNPTVSDTRRALAELRPRTAFGRNATGARIQRVATGQTLGFRYVPGVGSLLGYARVSTAEQDAALQVDELTAAGCYRGVSTDHTRLAGR
jgi:hypothetical protein